jgi:MTH538 TIR-like domain (DUF1863)
MRTYGEQRLQKAAFAAEARSDDPTRHKCFLAYHVDDAEEVATFVDKFGEVFIPRVLGVSPDDDFIESSDTDYVMDRIREKYLTDSTVTIVMVGKCTWARRFVDWEVYSSLRHDMNNKRNGVMAITLPSVADNAKQLPARVKDNVLGDDGDDGYARWWKYPKSNDSLGSLIEIAFQARATKSNLIDNTRARRLSNAACS